MHANPAERLPTDSSRKTGKKANAVKCGCCGMHGLCQIAGLDAPSTVQLDQIVSRREKVATGQALAAAGQPMKELIAVKSGAFVSTVLLANGDEQVVDFYLPGELIGLESLSGRRYPQAIVALEQSSICRFDLSRLYLLEERMVELQQHLIDALSKQALRDQWVPLLMGAKSAEQRIALFLLGLSSRFGEHQLPSLDFRLPMSRLHIANYLGLAMETVSRILKRFHTQGVIDVHARKIMLCDVDELRVIAGLAVGDR
jgi:CRP/FNR family transcriptional regulator